MDLIKVETIASGAALVISAGGFWWTSTKMEEINIKLEILQKSFITQVGKMSQHDDDIKIINSNINNFKTMIEELDTIKNNLGTLASEISDIKSKAKPQLRKYKPKSNKQTKEDKKIIPPDHKESNNIMDEMSAIINA